MFAVGAWALFDGTYLLVSHKPVGLLLIALGLPGTITGWHTLHHR